MRKNRFSAFIVIIAILLFTSSKYVFAQKNNKEFVEIEISKKKESFSHKAKVPITQSPFETDEKRVTENAIYYNGKTFTDGAFYYDGVVTVDCVNCDLESEYEIFSYAIRLDENLSEVNISVKFRNKRKCSINNKFVLERGKLKEFKLKCGIKLTAYYE